tara:strand:- start:1205 stop:1762 length:558 start_codon:yes stop_codon:yes gene_type:complete
MKTMLNDIENIQKTLKLMQGEMKKEIKEVDKLQKKKKKPVVQFDENGEKIVQKTGFALPVPLSPQLCDFLGMVHGSLLSRTDVTRLINAYIKEHSLQDKQNGRQINPDDKLNKLLNVTQNDLSYFTLQRYMKGHFIKKDGKVVENATVPTTDVKVTTVVDPNVAAAPATKKTTTPRKNTKKGVAA